jgi:hypothetical protein
MINNNNFYREFDNIFDELKFDNITEKNIIYNKLISLYENYTFNFINNKNIVSDLEIKTFIIDNNGLLKSDL